MTALGNKILIKPIAPAKTTISGIILPNNSKSDNGEVIEVGDAVNKPVGIQVNPGDRVFYPKNAAIPIDGTEYFAIKREDLWWKEKMP